MNGIMAKEELIEVEGIIKEELSELKKQYGDERRTALMGKVEDIEIEDLIAEEDISSWLLTGIRLSEGTADSSGSVRPD